MLEAQSGLVGVEVNLQALSKLRLAKMLEAAPTRCAQTSPCFTTDFPRPAAAMQINGMNPVTNLLDQAAALNITVLRAFASGTRPELPLQTAPGEGLLLPAASTQRRGRTPCWHCLRQALLAAPASVLKSVISRQHKPAPLHR